MGFLAYFWFYWLIGAIVLMLLELLFSGFVLLCFGFAALLTSLISLLGIGVELQLLSFIIFTVIAFVTIRPFFLRHMAPKGGLVETNVYALIGMVCRVIEDIDPDAHTGRVKVRGEEWGAMSHNAQKIPAGSKVKVLNISGNKLIVQPL
ncbi:MAG: NfeD family protein [Thermoflavifilum sp.]|nr:NfeD family protein [Thermoflavifilum sp.]